MAGAKLLAEIHIAGEADPGLREHGPPVVTFQAWSVGHRMTSKPNSRYRLRHDPADTWAVEDIFTGQTAEVNGIPQDGLDIEIADDLVNLLNREYIDRRKGTIH